MPLAIAKQLKADYPEIIFAKDSYFSWSNKQQTIFYIDTETEANTAQILHELAHALLEHTDYPKDITLIDMERQAWELAVEQLAPKYGISLKLTDDIVQNSLDSYRDWLHARSKCPSCGATGFEKTKNHYFCPNCLGSWRVNDAKFCQLRRYKTRV
ncbi:hypothetical protein EOM60_02000 [Candidatus Saccharibacteria bacterium]|nr:hypothetical protein [Candidatus Saccharibacteria bacterium]